MKPIVIRASSTRRLRSAPGLPSVMLLATAVPFLSFGRSMCPRQFPAAKAFEQFRYGTSPPAIQPRIFAACKCRSAPAPIPLKHHVRAAVGREYVDDRSTVQPGVLNKGGTPPSSSAIITHFAFPKWGESFESSRLSNVINAILLIVNVLRANPRLLHDF